MVIIQKGTTEGQTDTQTNGWPDTQTDERTSYAENHFDAYTQPLMVIIQKGTTEGQTAHRQTDGRTDKRTDERHA